MNARHPPDHHPLRRREDLPHTVRTQVGRLSAFILARRSRFWLARLYMGLDIMATCFVAWLSPASLNRSAFVDLSGISGWVSLALLAGLATTALLDTVINDLMPERFHMHWARQRRWTIYIAIALLMAAFIYVNVHNPVLTALLFRYVLDVAMGVTLALFDLMERAEDVRLEDVRLEGLA